MKSAKPEKIQCPACGDASFLKRSPTYDGFRKIGEILSCAACQHVFTDENNIPFGEPRTPAMFEPASPAPDVAAVFGSDSVGHCCRHCEHYVVNPFIQRCALHQRTVEATDDCKDFSKRMDET